MKIPRNKAAKGKKTKSRHKSKKSVQSSPPSQAKVWQPNEGLEEGEELDFDPSAYDCLVRFQDTWPSLSFDIIQGSENTSSTFPHTIQMVTGTQAANPRDNYIAITQVENIHKLPKKENVTSEEESSDDNKSEGDEEQMISSSAKISHQRLQHHGGINRVRLLPQDHRYAAIWDEKQSVHIIDLQPTLEQIHKNKHSAHSEASSIIFSRKHRTEGFALDWSKIKQGLLASGDCASHLLVWMPTESSQWQIQECSLGHADSVEDIQWSPSEETVFASCSVDKTIRIWDTRQLNGARITAEASTTDVNVISWSVLVDYMLASGDDQGILKIWDLRKFQSHQEVAKFDFHKKSITSVEWSPHEPSMLATSSADDQTAVWDLALERDPEEEAQFDIPKNAQLPETIPPQLLFLHAGQRNVKELHWHPHIHGMMLTTASDGINIFKPSNL